MRGPRHLGPYPDRLLDAQEAIEDDLLRLVDRMEAAGWLREEVLRAMRVVSINHTMADQENERLQDELDRLKRDS